MALELALRTCFIQTNAVVPFQIYIAMHLFLDIQTWLISL